MADKFIDIDNLLKEKSPKLKKWIPSFVVRYLKRVLHQNEINQILIDNKNKIFRGWNIILATQHGSVIIWYNESLLSSDQMFFKKSEIQK